MIYLYIDIKSILMRKGASYIEARPLTKNFFDMIKNAKKTIISLYGNIEALNHFAKDKWLYNIKITPLYLTNEEMIEHIGQHSGETIIIDSKEKSKIRELPNGIIKIRLSLYEEAKGGKEIDFVISNTRFLLEEFSRMETSKEKERRDNMTKRIQQENREEEAKSEGQ